MNCTTETPEKLPKETQSLYEALEQLPDPRSRRGLRYPLAMILTAVVLAKLSGESELCGIAQWPQYRADALRPASSPGRHFEDRTRLTIEPHVLG